jgi:hypothetical protein
MLHCPRLNGYFGMPEPGRSSLTLLDGCLIPVASTPPAYFDPPKFGYGVYILAICPASDFESLQGPGLWLDSAWTPQQKLLTPKSVGAVGHVHGLKQQPPVLCSICERPAWSSASCPIYSTSVLIKLLMIKLEQSLYISFGTRQRRSLSDSSRPQSLHSLYQRPVRVHPNNIPANLEYPRCYCYSSIQH